MAYDLVSSYITEQVQTVNQNAITVRKEILFYLFYFYTVLYLSS